MILIKQDIKSYYFKCECGHIIRHPKQGNDLIKCYTCGLLGTIDTSLGILDIRTKAPNLKYAMQQDKELAI